MGFIKSIARKTLHQVIDLVCLCFGNSTGFGAITKDFAMLRHLLWLFLTHCTAQHICAAEGVTANHLRHLHHLLLIHHDAVGFA